VEARDRDPVALVERIWRSHLGHSSVGFKLNRGQDPRAFAHVLGDRRLRKIVLRRHNRVRTFVSEAIAERTGEWESYEDLALAADQPRLTVHAPALLAHSERNEAYYRGLESKLVAGGRPWLELSYERLGDARERERVLRFLGVSSSPLSAATRRQHPQPLRELIANLDELREELRGTDFEQDLCEAG
jgi:hypothetical protein